MVRDSLSAAGNRVATNGKIAARDPLAGLVGDGDPPKMILLVVLVEPEDVVFQFVALLLLLSLGIRGNEVDLSTVGRPLDVRDRSVVLRERRRFAPQVGKHIDLRLFLSATLGEKRDGASVG